MVMTYNLIAIVDNKSFNFVIVMTFPSISSTSDINFYVIGLYKM